MSVKLGGVIRQLGDSDTYRLVKGKDVDLTDADLMGAALEDADLIIIDDGAAGTQASTKKSAISRIWDYIVSKLGSATELTVGNYTFDADQTVGAGQDNYVLTYDNGTGNISLEAAPSAGDTNITVVENASTVTIQSSTGTNDDIQSATTSLAGVMSATDKTKLNGIEASADVTDAANVAAAGAVMESDFTANGQLVIGGTSGAAIATLTQGSNVTITNGDGTITIAANDTNTTYTAGDGPGS